MGVCGSWREVRDQSDHVRSWCPVEASCRLLAGDFLRGVIDLQEVTGYQMSHTWVTASASGLARETLTGPGELPRNTGSRHPDHCSKRQGDKHDVVTVPPVSGRQVCGRSVAGT